jgi:O-antigen/teichoic acid export membrane protein
MLVMLGVVYMRFLPRRLELDPAWWPLMLRNGIPFAMIGVLNILYTRADVQVLTVLSHCGAHGGASCIPVGRYGATTRLLDALVGVFVGGIQAAVLAPFTRTAVQSRPELALLVRSSTTLMLLLGVPIAVLTTFFAPEAMHVTAGREFIAAAPALAVLIWAFPCILVVNIFFSALYALHQQKVVTMAFAANLVFNVALNILLIPLFSYMAASALTVASEILNCIIVLIALRRALGPLGLGPSVAKMGAVAAVTSIVLFLLHPFGIVVGLPVGAAVMLAGLRGVRLLGPTERQILATLPLVGRYATLL